MSDRMTRSKTRQLSNRQAAESNGKSHGDKKQTVEEAEENTASTAEKESPISMLSISPIHEETFHEVSLMILTEMLQAAFGTFYFSVHILWSSPVVALRTLALTVTLLWPERTFAMASGAGVLLHRGTVVQERDDQFMVTQKTPVANDRIEKMAEVAAAHKVTISAVEEKSWYENGQVKNAVQRMNIEPSSSARPTGDILERRCMLLEPGIMSRTG
ncbi:unnamed protein product, partial [Mesorhabditis spiculigera]